MNANDLAAQFIATVTWESLPELVQEKARMCLVRTGRWRAAFSTGWNRERMSDKFRWLAGFVLSPDQTDEILETLWRFDYVTDVRELTRLLH